jgi:hypothetical protein
MRSVGDGKMQVGWGGSRSPPEVICAAKYWPPGRQVSHTVRAHAQEDFLQ